VEKLLKTDEALLMKKGKMNWSNFKWEKIQVEYSTQFSEFCKIELYIYAKVLIEKLGHILDDFLQRVVKIRNHNFVPKISAIIIDVSRSFGNHFLQHVPSFLLAL
jgi:vacuolar-type H+-ATPase catalytic subunit A/Vma1